MRTVITLLAILPTIAAIAQGDGTLAQVSAPLALDSGSVRASRWSGRGGSFAIGQPIEPMPLRAITWEFGDGSLSHILAPKRWKPSEGSTDRSSTMAPFREQSGGSPCVSAGQGDGPDDGAQEPRPQVFSGTGQPLLVTTGLGERYLQVRMLDVLGREGAPVIDQRFAPGRWALGAIRHGDRPVFITLQDISTGERWRAGVDL